jgi:queuine/archaeosine tRNA-ribosyltransferase
MTAEKDPQPPIAVRRSDLTPRAPFAPAPCAGVSLPQIDPAALRSPSSEVQNEYQSAGALMRRLAQTIVEWRKQLPEGVQPALMAIVQGGPQIKIQSLAQEGFHGIRIDGYIGEAPCILLAHQATVQILCYVEEIMPPEKPKRSIGFIIEGEQTEA